MSDFIRRTGESVHAWVQDALDKGMTVYVQTPWRTIEIQPKHAHMVRLAGKHCEVQQRGSWQAITYCELTARHEDDASRSQTWAHIDGAEVTHTVLHEPSGRSFFDYGACHPAHGWTAIETPEDGPELGHWLKVNRLRVLRYNQGSVMVWQCVDRDAVMRVLAQIEHEHGTIKLHAPTNSDSSTLHRWGLPDVGLALNGRYRPPGDD